MNSDKNSNLYYAILKKNNQNQLIWSLQKSKSSFKKIFLSWEELQNYCTDNFFLNSEIWVYANGKYQKIIHFDNNGKLREKKIGTSYFATKNKKNLSPTNFSNIENENNLNLSKDLQVFQEKNNFKNSFLTSKNKIIKIIFLLFIFTTDFIIFFVLGSIIG